MRRLVRFIVRDPSTRYSLRARALRTPIVSETICLVDPHLRPTRITRSADLVLDGFPRSGNSFARALIAQAGPGLDIRSHMHSPRAVIRGISLGLPVVLLVRDPFHSSASLIQYIEGLDRLTALKEWIRFYGPLQKYIQDLVIVGFDDLVTDHVSTLRRVESACSLGLDVSEDASTSRANAFSEIESAARREGGVHLHGRVARPDTRRKTANEIMRDMTREELDVLSHAHQIFGSFVARDSRDASH